MNINIMIKKNWYRLRMLITGHSGFTISNDFFLANPWKTCAIVCNGQWRLPNDTHQYQPATLPWLQGFASGSVEDSQCLFVSAQVYLVLSQIVFIQSQWNRENQTYRFDTNKQQSYHWDPHCSRVFHTWNICIPCQWVISCDISITLAVQRFICDTKQPSTVLMGSCGQSGSDHWSNKPRSSINGGFGSANEMASADTAVMISFAVGNALVHAQLFTLTIFIGKPW